MTVSSLPTRQEEKSAATRRRVLDATFMALHDVGYARTTTSEVCRRAGVARGTLLHHFPTTQELVTAAAEDIFLRRLGEYRQAFDALPHGEARGGVALGMLWKIVSGPTYYAWLEIVVASRTDRPLRERVRGVMARFGDAVDENYRQMFPGVRDFPIDPKLVPSIVFALLNGLAVDRIFADEEQTEDVVTALRRLADLTEAFAQSRGAPS